MKQTKRILTAGIILILLCVGTFVAFNLMPRDENNKIVFPEWIIGVEEEQVASLEVTNTHGSYSATFTDGVVISGYEDYPLTEEVLEDLRPSAGSVYAYDTIDRSGKDLAQYGLSSPIATATVTDVDGNQYHLRIGSQLPSGTAYYCMNSESSTVYAVEEDYVKFFLAPKQDFISKQITSIPENTAYMVDHLAISYQDKPIFAVVAMDDTEKVHQNSGKLYKMIYPYQGLGNDDNVVDYINTVCNLTASTVKSLDTGKESLKEHGLSTPAYIIEFSYQGEVHQLYASEAENGFCNMYAEGGNIIYSVLAQKLRLLELDALDFVTPYQFERDINKVDRIMIYTEKGNYTYHVKVENNEAKATIDGKELNSRAFEDFYNLITTSKIAGVTKKPSCNSAMVFIFRYQSALGMENDTVTFCPIDGRTYYLDINGSGNFYVSSSYIDKVLECIEKLNAGEEFSIAY